MPTVDIASSVSTLYSMRTRIAKWGNSLALRLPKAMIASHAFKDGTEIELIEHAEGILMRPASTRYDLKDLLKEVRKDNLHQAIETGDQTGDETW